MALPLQNSFEGGTSGTAISAANSGGVSGDAFTGVTGTGVPTFDSTHAAHGSLGMLYNSAGSGAVQWNTTVSGTPNDTWGRSYFYMTSAPTAIMAIWRGFTPTSATASRYNVRVGTTSKLSILVIAGTTVASTTSLSLSTWYRVEWHAHNVVSGTCTLNVTLFLGDATAATETLTQATGTGAAGDTSINQHWFGPANTPIVTSFWVDDVQVNTTGFPGPAISKLPTGALALQAVNRAATY